MVAYPELSGARSPRRRRMTMSVFWHLWTLRPLARESAPAAGRRRLPERREAQIGQTRATARPAPSPPSGQGTAPTWCRQALGTTGIRTTFTVCIAYRHRAAYVSNEAPISRKGKVHGRQPPCPYVTEPGRASALPSTTARFVRSGRLSVECQRAQL